ncbi:MAG: hypothetical protein ACT443_13180 [Gemmatimonadota bacterium]
MRSRWLAAFVIFTWSASAQAQQPPADALRVFLDCSWYCDDAFVRTEINYVNWVRDRADAQVHVIVSRLATGGGGSQFTLTFTGLRQFEAREDTLRYTASTTDSDDVTRRGLTRTLELGLVSFLAATPAAARLDVTWRAAAAGAEPAAAPAPTRDPWKNWVFSIGARTNFDGEESQRFARLNGNLTANRTTEDFKIRIGLYGNYNESEFTFDNGDGDTTVVSIRKNYSSSVLAVRSMGDHWSLGVTGGAESGTFGNISLGLNGGPAIEYSIWPYSEATRRSLVFRYSTGVRSFDYREITVYGRTAETHPSHSLTGELALRQRFGSISLESTFSQYLHETSFYNARVFANANLKLFKGLSLDFFGSYARVRDQLSLPATDLTPEEVLLQQRQLETGYRYFGGFGLRYSFGSIFNNVVNPRFGEGGGGMIFFN